MVSRRHAGLRVYVPLSLFKNFSLSASWNVMSVEQTSMMMMMMMMMCKVYAVRYAPFTILGCHAAYVGCCLTL
jgi:hypothetical protein